MGTGTPIKPCAEVDNAKNDFSITGVLWAFLNRTVLTTIPLVRILPNRMKSFFQRDIYIPIFT